MQKDYILGRLQPFQGTRKMIVRDQDVPDIINAMLTAHKQYAGDYDKISEDFWTGDPKTTAKKIFDFLKKNVRYKIESDKDQRIMSPAAIVSLGQNDCKNYALFINGILDSLRRKGLLKNEIFYRFASYRLLDNIPHHVFAVMKVNGEEIFIDPVLSNFNDHSKPYYFKIDKKPMAIYSVNGIRTGPYVSGIFDFLKSKERRAAEAAAKETRIATTPTIAPIQAKRPKFFFKITLAPSRGAFLLLVGLNFLGLATKLLAALQRNKDAVNNFWANLGGNTNELIRKVNQGAVKKRIFGEDVFLPQPGQMGEAVTATTAAAAAAAAPILVKLVDFLAKLGISKDDLKEIGETGKRLLAKSIKDAVTNRLDSAQAQQELTQDEIDQIINETEVRTDRGNLAALPWLVGIGGALYILSRKR